MLVFIALKTGPADHYCRNGPSRGAPISVTDDRFYSAIAYFFLDRQGCVPVGSRPARDSIQRALLQKRLGSVVAPTARNDLA
jgi:hypothetical protein